MGKVTVEDRGRIMIPKSIREEAGIKGGEKMRVDRRNGEIVLTPVNEGSSLKELKGCVKETDINPLDVKKIWEE